RMSSPPRTLCELFTHEKFGCRLKPVVVSLLRLLRPRFWYSTVPPVDAPNPLGAEAVCTKFRRGNTLFGSALTNDAGKPSSDGSKFSPGSERASSRYWFSPARTFRMSDELTVRTQSLTPVWLMRQSGNWPSCAGPLRMPLVMRCSVRLL